MAIVEVRRNLATNPRAATAAGWFTNNPASWTNTNNTVISGHPLGIVTACKTVPLAPVIGASSSLMSSYNMDVLLQSAVVRGVGLWIWSNVAGQAHVYLGNDLAGTDKYTIVPANTWTWITCKNIGSGYAIAEFIKSGLVAAPDFTLITASMVELNKVPGDFFDGASVIASPYAASWAGAANGSESIMTRDTAIPIPNVSRNDNIYQGLVDTGFGPGTISDMEYKRLLAANGLSAPQKLTLYDLYSRAGERPRLRTYGR